MRFPSRLPLVHHLPGVAGTIRMDRRMSAVLRKAHRGDIAVIDRLDLDRDSAESLLEQAVSVVVNASPFISGRYPNLGPELLAKAGVVLLEVLDAEVFTKLEDGATARVHEGTIYLDEQPVVSGQELSLAEVQERMDNARVGLATQLQSFTHNTTDFLRREQGLLLHGRGVPELRTEMAGRPVVVVVRGFDHEAELRRMRRFVREQKPVLVGVDAGADALLAARLKPDVVMIGENGLARPGSVQSRTVSDKALTGAREVVLHSDASDVVVGSERLERLGVRPKRVSSSGSTEDIALLIADIKGASLIVTVGTHATLDEFLDRQRSGLASTFLTRLRLGPRLVDAKSVPMLYAGRVPLWQLVLVLLAGLVALAAAVALTPRGEVWADELGAAARPFLDWIEGLLR